jgi:hypothetical protein
MEKDEKMIPDWVLGNEEIHLPISELEDMKFDLSAIYNSRYSDDGAPMNDRQEDAEHRRYRLWLTSMPHHKSLDLPVEVQYDRTLFLTDKEANDAIWVNRAAHKIKMAENMSEHEEKIRKNRSAKAEKASEWHKF